MTKNIRKYYKILTFYILNPNYKVKSSNWQSYAQKDHLKVLKTDMTFLSYLAGDQTHHKLLSTFDLNCSKTAEN